MDVLVKPVVERMEIMVLVWSCCGEAEKGNT